MYSSIDDLLKDMNKSELLDLVNDETRAYADIDLTDEADACAVRITEQISAADSEIDGYIGSRYTLPIVTVPERLMQISKDIAIYNCYKRRHRQDMSDSVVSIYKMRIDELKGIQKGTVSLDVPEQPQASAEGGIKTNKTASSKFFNDDLMAGY
jgi:phage gp36-like protein